MPIPPVGFRPAPAASTLFGAPSILALTNVFLLLLTLLFGQQILAMLDWRAFAIVVLLSTVFAGWCIYRAFETGVWSLSFLLYLVIALFHVGLYIGPAFTGTSTEPPRGIWTAWINEPNMRVVSIPLLIAFFSYAALTGIAAWVYSGKVSEKARCEATSDDLSEFAWQRRSLADIGSVLLIIGVGAWFFLSISAAGISMFTTTYEEFLAATLYLPMGALYLVIAIGAVFVSQDPFRFWGKVSLTFFAAFLLAGFVIGLRGETLMPLVGGLAVYARRNRMPSPKTFALASVIVLLAIAAVAQVRSVGLSSLSESQVTIGPLDGLAEMGYSVRPLVASIDWHVNAGEEYRYGSTYWAPFERGVSTLVAAPMMPAEDDYRLMNVEVAQRIGQIGGSIIAEAHHNFGNGGIALVMGITGFASGVLSRGNASPVRLAIFGIFAVMILMHVRNSFAPLPLWGAFGIVCLTVAIAFSKVRQK